MATIVYYRDKNFITQEMFRVLEAVSEPYVDVELGKDMLVEDFLATYPNNHSLPLVVMNGVKYNDVRSLKEHLLGRPDILLG